MHARLGRGWMNQGAKRSKAFAKVLAGKTHGSDGVTDPEGRSRHLESCARSVGSRDPPPRQRCSPTPPCGLALQRGGTQMTKQDDMQRAHDFGFGDRAACGRAAALCLVAILEARGISGIAKLAARSEDNTPLFDSRADDLCNWRCAAAAPCPAI